MQQNNYKTIHMTDSTVTMTEQLIKNRQDEISGIEEHLKNLRSELFFQTEGKNIIDLISKQENYVKAFYKVDLNGNEIIDILIDLNKAFFIGWCNYPLNGFELLGLGAFANGKDYITYIRRKNKFNACVTFGHNPNTNNIQ